MRRHFRRIEPTTFHRCLAVHMAAADRWPQRNRLPTTVLGKLGHVAVGAVLGAVVTAIVIGWMTR
jgi:hypothetical protein